MMPETETEYRHFGFYQPDTNLNSKRSSYTIFLDERSKAMIDIRLEISHDGKNSAKKGCIGTIYFHGGKWVPASDSKEDFIPYLIIACLRAKELYPKGVTHLDK